MKRTLLILAMFVMAVLPSCKRSMTDIKNPADQNWITQADQTFETQFQAIWEAMNQSYVLWDYDTVNWDARRDKMINLGKKYDEMQKQGTFDFTSVERQIEMYNLFSGLLDHHLIIYVQNPYDTTMERLQIMPSILEVQLREGYHDNYGVPFSYSVIQNMINEGKLEAESGSISSFESAALGSTKYVMTYIFKVDDGYVAYLRLTNYNIFEIVKYGLAGNPCEAYDLIKNHFANVKNYKEKGLLKGIILDNRGNGGGSLEDAGYVIGPYITDELLVHNTRTKSGLGKYDYSIWRDYYVQPKTDKPEWYVGDLGNIPYVAMEDMNSISMGEISGSCVAHLNSGIIIGERSWGGHGGLQPTMTYEQQGWCGTIQYDKKHHYLYNPLMCSKIWNNHTKQYEMQEGIGLIPDIEVRLDVEAYSAGYDNQLMRAIEYIKNGK